MGCSINGTLVKEKDDIVVRQHSENGNVLFIMHVMRGDMYMILRLSRFNCPCVQSHIQSIIRHQFCENDAKDHLYV